MTEPDPSTYSVGADNQLFFTGTLGGQGSGSQFSITGQQFVYDASKGNLLLTMSVIPQPGSYGETYFDATWVDLTTSSLIGGGTSFPTGEILPAGLVTTFSSVPEPSLPILLGIGIAGVVGLCWRRERN